MNHVIVGLMNVRQQPVIGQYAVCAEYTGTVPAGETVGLRCEGTNLEPARYVVVQLNDSNYLAFCDLDVCVSGIYRPY